MSIRRLALALALLLVIGCSRPAPSAAPAASVTSAPPASTAIAVASIAPSASTAPAAPSASSAASASVDAGDPLEVEAQRQWAAGTREDIVYVPTPQKVVDKMLDVAKVTKSDIVYDLGCGDGRIVVTAAKKFGAHATGFDLSPDRVREARDNLKAAGHGIELLASIRQANVFSVDLSPASVVTLYLLPELNVRLIPQLEKLRPGSRVVSHDFDMKGVKPEGQWEIMAPEFVNDEGLSAWQGKDVPEDKKHYKERKHVIYLWVTPLKKEADAGAPH